MMGRTTKAAFYSLAGPLMKINSSIYRTFRAPKNGTLKVHLGPGQGNYLTGWVNVDANMFTGRCDVWADLRNPLPFREATVTALYSHHVIEHLPNLEQHFRDVYRCLKPGGIYRVGGPNGDSAIAKFREGDNSWFGDFPDSRASIGGRFENFVFCRQEHLTILTASFLAELMQNAGLKVLKSCMPTKETGFPNLFQECLGIEHENDFAVPHTLIIECQK